MKLGIYWCFKHEKAQQYGEAAGTWNGAEQSCRPLFGAAAQLTPHLAARTKHCQHQEGWDLTAQRKSRSAQTDAAQGAPHGALVSDVSNRLGSFWKSLIVGKKEWVPRRCHERQGSWRSSLWLSVCLSAWLITFVNENITRKNLTVKHTQALVPVGATELVVMGSVGGMYWEKRGLKLQWSGNQVFQVPCKTEFRSLVRGFKNLLLGMV